jgi:hypothetical protein
LLCGFDNPNFFFNLTVNAVEKVDQNALVDPPAQISTSYQQQ